jgi:hypothetical protein
MEVHLTPDQEAFVRQGIASGRFHSEADAVAEALSLWGSGSAPALRFLPPWMPRKLRWIAVKESWSPSNPCASWPTM